MFVFASSLSLADLMTNKMLHNHANQVIKTIDKIIISMIRSPISDQEKQKLLNLGKLHYHFGLKQEHFKVL